MVRPKHPCKRDCPERNAECHGKCGRWQEYEAKKLQFYEEKYKACNLNVRPYDQILKNLDRMAMSGKRGTYSTVRGD